MPYCLTIQDDDDESKLYFYSMNKAMLMHHKLLIEKINDYSNACDEISIYFGAANIHTIDLQKIVNTIIRSSYGNNEHKYNIIFSEITFQDFI